MRVVEAVAVPITLDADGISLSQTPAGAGALTLDGVAAASYPYINGYTSTSRTEARLDPPRPVSITSASNISNRTFVVVGIDRANMPITETITGPNATTVSGNLLFKAIYSITISGSAAGALTVGWTAVSYTKWIQVGNESQSYQWQFRAFIARSATATYHVEGTSQPMSRRAIHGLSAKSDAPTYAGGDYPDEIQTLAGPLTDHYTSNNDAPIAYIRLRVTAQTGNVTARSLKNISG